jgi:hypothetical protein
MNRRYPIDGPRHAAHSRRLLARARCGVLAVVSSVALAGQAAAPSSGHAEWLDPRVMQSTIVDTICVPGYVERVSPSFDAQMRQKEKLLKQRGIDRGSAPDYALDHRMPVLLGGSPNGAANLDLRPWDGHDGQRRKERLAVFLKRCVCTGDMTLANAQNAISGNWADRYPNLSSLSCGG